MTMKSNLIYTTSPEETKACAAGMIREIKTPRPILLFGELGSGKTTFVKGIARAFNIPEKQIKSPTFTYVREIDLPDNQTLYHVDLYRYTEQPRRANDEYIEESLNLINDESCTGQGDASVHSMNREQSKPPIIIIEWPENMKKLPDRRTEVHFAVTSEQSRTITITHHTT